MTRTIRQCQSTVQGWRQGLAESSKLLLQLPHEEVGSQVGWSFHHHQSHLSHHHQTLPLCTREKYLPIVSVSSICPYIPDEIAEHPQPPQPSPVTINDQEEYEVEEILDSRFRWGKLWYLVKLIGWSNSDNMWLPHTEVHTPAVVEEFHLQHPGAPCTSSTSTPTTLCHP